MAASDEDLDWHRFGPEIAATILRRQAESAPALEAMTPQPTMSGRLANAITNPKLQTFFGLNGESDFEVGTVDG
jgi:hypothetical protein